MTETNDLNKLYDEADKLKEEGKLEEAVELLRTIIQQDPNFTLAHLAIAKHLTGLGKAEEAVAHAQKAVELEPEDPFSYTQLSVICQRAGLINEAEEAKAQAAMLQARR